VSEEYVASRLQGREIIQERKHMLALFFNHEDGSEIFLRKVVFIFNGVQADITKNIELFINTAVRT
jgi:hypothetical protein